MIYMAINEEGYATCQSEDSLYHLSQYLQSDIQGDASTCDHMLDILNNIKLGRLEMCEGVGNAYFVKINPESVLIKCEWDESDPLVVSFDLFERALLAWRRLLTEGEPQILSAQM